MKGLGDIQGCGIGLRREFLKDLVESDFDPDWYEIAPENWISMPYEYRSLFEKAVDKKPVAAHGLSLSIGSPDPLDYTFLKKVKQFLDAYNILHYSEHLSFSTYYGGQTYELLPLPMTKKMADFVSEKLKKVSDYLKRPVIMENATYYYVPYAEIPEADFINLVLDKSGMPMLLDVNNVYVNSVNHSFDAKEFIKSLNLDTVSYIHVAGHSYFEAEKIIVDTHGKPVPEEVWELLEFTLDLVPAPVLLERDNNIPPLAELRKEYEVLQKAVSPKLRRASIA